MAHVSPGSQLPLLPKDQLLTGKDGADPILSKRVLQLTRGTAGPRDQAQGPQMNQDTWPGQRGVQDKPTHYRGPSATLSLPRGC